jgi:Domain of unknown function (DUF5664)
MSEALHKDEGKLGLQYILAMSGLDSLARVGDYGAKKYDQWNYTKGMSWMKLLGSCSRHLISFIRGEDLDLESGLPHLAHLAFDALILLGYMEDHREKDDRFGKTNLLKPLLPF